MRVEYLKWNTIWMRLFVTEQQENELSRSKTSYPKMDVPPTQSENGFSSSTKISRLSFRFLFHTDCTWKYQRLKYIKGGKAKRLYMLPVHLQENMWVLTDSYPAFWFSDGWSRLLQTDMKVKERGSSNCQCTKEEKQACAFSFFKGKIHK